MAIAPIFSALWISGLLPLMRTGEKAEFLYSVYILDLCFIMPALAISAVLAARRRGVGLLTPPALCVFGFGLIGSPALRELVKPLHAQPFAAGQFGLDLGLSLAFLVLAVLCLRGLRTSPGAV